MSWQTNKPRQSNWLEEPSGASEINLGFGPRYQNAADNWHSQKRVQILKLREKPPEKQIHYCSKCNGKVDWIETSRKFLCYSCGLSYDELYDRPLASIDQAVQPLQGEGSEKLVFRNISINRQLQGEYQSDIVQETRSYNGGRVRHVKLKPGVSPAAYNIRSELEE